MTEARGRMDGTMTTVVIVAAAAFEVVLLVVSAVLWTGEKSYRQTRELGRSVRKPVKPDRFKSG